MRASDITSKSSGLTYITAMLDPKRRSEMTGVAKILPRYLILLVTPQHALSRAPLLNCTIVRPADIAPGQAYEILPTCKGGRRDSR